MSTEALERLRRLATQSQGKPEQHAIEAMVAAAEQTLRTDDQIKRVREASPIGTPAGVREIEIAILNAEATRELTRAMNAATEGLEYTANKLNGGISDAAGALRNTDASTKKLACWTFWLVWATVALAVAAIVAALIGAWATNGAPPEIVVLPR